MHSGDCKAGPEGWDNITQIGLVSPLSTPDDITSLSL